MVNRTLALIAGTAAACGLAVAATAMPASADESGVRTDVGTLTCGDAFADLDHRDYDYTFATDEVVVLHGPHETCEVIEVAKSGQRTDYHCYVMAGGDSYTYLRNVATGNQGWVNDEELTDGGSDYHC